MTGRAGSPRLGRGLASLLGEPTAATEAGVSAPSAIPIDAIEPGPFQPRQPISDADLADLIASIRANGVLQPLLLRQHPDHQDRFQIIAGERRWRAAQAAGLDSVPALIRELDGRAALAAALVENLQRQDLNAIEEAEGYRRLGEEFGLTQEALGEAVGKSRSHVANLVRLLGLPDGVRGELRRGTLTAGHARALLAHPQPEQAAQTVIARGLNVRQTEALVQRELAIREPSARERDPETTAIERDLSERLGLKVALTFDGKGGAVRIAYRSLDQLDGLITLLSR